MSPQELPRIRDLDLGPLSLLDRRAQSSINNSLGRGLPITLNPSIPTSSGWGLPYTIPMSNNPLQRESCSSDMPSYASSSSALSSTMPSPILPQTVTPDHHHIEASPIRTALLSRKRAKGNRSSGRQSIKRVSPAIGMLPDDVPKAMANEVQKLKKNGNEKNRRAKQREWFIFITSVLTRLGARPNKQLSAANRHSAKGQENGKLPIMGATCWLLRQMENRNEQFARLRLKQASIQMDIKACLNNGANPSILLERLDQVGSEMDSLLGPYPPVSPEFWKMLEDNETWDFKAAIDRFLPRSFTSPQARL